MGETIDSVERHLLGAGTRERAARHIGLFLVLAARHGLTSAEVDVADLKRDPADYVICEWDGVLDTRALVAPARTFFAHEYPEQYFPAYADAVLQLGGDSAYGDVDEAELEVQLGQVVGSLAAGFRLLNSLLGSS